LTRERAATGGLTQGTISIRFQDLDPNSTDLPTVSSQVVSLDELPDVLPATTVYATPQDRLDQIASRKSGFNKRFVRAAERGVGDHVTIVAAERRLVAAPAFSDPR